MPGQGIEGQQVLLPLAPLVHGAEDAKQVRRLIDVPDELAAGPVSRPKAQPLQLVQKVCAVLLPPGRPGHHGGIEVLPLVGSAQLGQPVCGKAVHRGAQGGQQGHVLPGVVHQAQDGQGHVYLGGGQKVLVPVGHPGDVLLPQGAGVVVQHRAGAAQQDHHVAGPQGPLVVPLGHHHGLVQQLPHPPGGKAGLGLVLVLPVLLALLPQIGQVQHVQLQGIVRPLRVGECRPGDQSLVLGVVQLSKVPGHDVSEQVVAAQQHLGPGAEVPGQHPPPGLAWPGAGSVWEAAVFVQKDGGVGQAEAINGLLHVPHLKQGAPLVGDGLEDGVLHLVGVLILVHLDLFKAIGPHAGGLGGLALVIQQQLHRQVLQVGEVHQPPPPLLPGIVGQKVCRQVHQGLDHRAGQGQLLPQLPAVLLEQGGELFQLLLAPGADGLDALGPVCGVHLRLGVQLFCPLFLPAQGGERDGQTGGSLVPAVGGEQLVQPGGAFVQGGSIVCLQQFILPHQGQGLAQALPTPITPAAQLLQQDGPPGGVLHVRARGQLPAALLLPQPAGGVGVALHPSGDVQHDLGQAAVVPPGGQSVHQLGEGPLGVHALIPAVQGLFQHPGHEHLGLPLVAQAKVGV